jgi:hypothetical protein
VIPYQKNNVTSSEGKLTNDDDFRSDSKDEDGIIELKNGRFVPLMRKILYYFYKMLI